MNELEREQDQPIGSGPDRARRRLTGAGLGAPVIMTLASRPVFGAQCLSNMMSGNLSNPGLDSCVTGFGPEVWGAPDGTVNGLGTLEAWQVAGYDFGTHPGNARTSNWASYSGGTLMSDFTAECGILPPPGTDPLVLTMREVVNMSGTAPIARHLTTAYLNAKLSENMLGFQYILKPYQVIGLGSGAIPLPPGYADLKQFLDSTWGSS